MEEHRQSATEDDRCTLPSLVEAPWLILTHESELENQTFCLMNNKSYSKTIIELHGKSILASSHGWLVLQERVNRSRYSIWNPITRQCLNLPELLDPPGEPTCVINSPLDDNAPCVVLLSKTHMFSCWPTMRYDCRWVKQSLVLEGRIVRIVEAVAVNGDIYVNAFLNSGNDNDDDNNGGYNIFDRIKICDSDSSSNLVVFEPLEIQPPCGSIKFPIYCYRSNFLVEVCGVLYVVHVLTRPGVDHYDIVKALVWRLDLPQMKWIRIDSLGDQALLLRHGCSTWCWADASCSGIEGNCIYITLRWSRTMRQYRLQDDSYISLNPYPDILPTFDDPIWFMPCNPTRLSPDRLITTKSEDIEDNKHVEDLDEMTPTSLLICRLPLDMLISVTEYLHLFDNMNLRATCKILYSSLSRPQWRSNCAYPLFMSLKNTKGGICELWDPCQNTCHTIMTPHSPDLLSTIKFCKDGWLLLDIQGYPLQCFNPFKGKRYKYPSREMTTEFPSLAFSTSPTSPNCLTVGIRALNGHVSIIYHQVGDDQWEYNSAKLEFDSDTGIEFKSNNNSRPMYHNGAFYFLDVSGNLGVLKMVEGKRSWEKWSCKVHKGLILEDIFLYSGHLAELDGQLVSVFIKDNGKRFQVFKFDTLGNDWVALHDLGDYMLFLSPASSFSVSTKDNSMRNRIYLPKRIGNEMVFHSLNTGMYHTSSSQNPYKDFYGMRSQSFCCWL